MFSQPSSKFRGLVTALASALLLQSGVASAVVTNLYEFRVQKGANTEWWLDNFADGSPPPTSPFNNAFAGATCQLSQPYLCYSVGGVFPNDSETGNRLTLDSAQGAATTNALGAPRLSQRALLISNTDSGNSTNGLKRNHDFQVSGIFDLSIPIDNSSGYGIRLEDSATGHAASDQAALYLQRDSSGTLGIQFQDSNFVAGTRDIVDSAGITGTEGQRLRLFLTHAADSNVVTGAYQFENAGIWGVTHTFANPATIFGTVGDADLWTRASFSAFQAPIPEPGTYALMLAGLGLVGWQLRRR